jgi:hypothetical protein
MLFQNKELSANIIATFMVKKVFRDLETRANQKFELKRAEFKVNLIKQMFKNHLSLKGTCIEDRSTKTL